MTDIIHSFSNIQSAMRKNEVWRNVDFSNLISDSLTLPSNDAHVPTELHCNIPNLDALRLTLVNGYCQNSSQTLPDGTICCSLNEARQLYPSLVEPYLGKCIKTSNPYEEINAANYTDGIFIFVPDNTETTRPLQIMSLTKSEKQLFLQTRNLVVVGRNSRLTLLHCDDSYDLSRSMSNNVTEIHLAEGASLEHYKLQNLNDISGLLNHNYITTKENSTLKSFVISLNGGHIRNHTEVRMLGTNAGCEVNGLYLIDKEQQMDNYIFVEHAFPNCRSNELFKGIMDDAARATFNGHVLVAEGAVKTEAYQSNKNILLTNKANIFSKPFLEIYNDDVKCSHGSSTGQIDEQALFYIRSRGISERTARTLLYYAFCDEVINKISLSSLRTALSDMVKKRLHGELNACSDCALRCSTPCSDSSAEFFIDASNL